jgi:thiol-disulfide isomerase/thioredoxin
MMRRLIWRIVGLLVLLLCSSSITIAQKVSPAPACIAPTELRKELRSTLDQRHFGGVSFDRQVIEQAVKLNKLIDKYPKESEPQRQLVELGVWIDTRRLPSVQERFRKQELSNPSDPLALFATGYSLLTTDAEVARNKLTKATSVAPDFPWSYLALARLYAEGKTADPTAMGKSVERFFTLCPNLTDSYSKWLLAKAGTKELRNWVATKLRSYLEIQTASDLLTDYETLWGLEFQIHSPQEFDAVRAQIAKDLKHVETMNPQPDAEFQAFLIRGYKQSGALEEVLREKEDRLLKEYPKSREAYFVISSRWEKTHKRPEEEKDLAAWSQYETEWRRAEKEWIRQFTDYFYLTHYAWTNTIEDDEGLPSKEVFEAFENDVRQAEESPFQYAWPYIKAAEYLLKHRLSPDRAVDILEKAKKIRAREKASAQLNTNRAPEEILKSDEHLETEWWGITSSLLEAARQLNKPELVAAIRAEVEAPLINKKYESWYWMNRARLARLDGRTADSIAFYHLAYQTGTEQPIYWHGKIQDRFTDEVKPFWKDLRGTDVAWELWRKPIFKGQELTDSRWEKATKPLASFELTDLSGKTWRLKDLKGKSLLINLWATWCGPCRVELPYIQRLYQSTKDRDDIVVLSFNVDEDPGLVPPFVTEHKYQFPVLLAWNFASDFLQQGIPQTLIVDASGAWRWTQLGFGASDDWETTILAKLESAKTQ